MHKPSTDAYLCNSSLCSLILKAYRFHIYTVVDVGIKRSAFLMMSLSYDLRTRCFTVFKLSSNIVLRNAKVLRTMYCYFQHHVTLKLSRDGVDWQWNSTNKPSVWGGGGEPRHKLTGIYFRYRLVNTARLKLVIFYGYFVCKKAAGLIKSLFAKVSAFGFLQNWGLWFSEREVFHGETAELFFVTEDVSSNELYRAA